MRAPLALTIASLCLAPGDWVLGAPVTEGPGPSRSALLLCFCCNYKLQLIFSPPTSSFRACLQGVGRRRRAALLPRGDLGVALPRVTPHLLRMGAAGAGGVTNWGKRVDAGWSLAGMLKAATKSPFPRGDSLMCPPPRGGQSRLGDALL